MGMPNLSSSSYFMRAVCRRESNKGSGCGPDQNWQPVSACAYRHWLLSLAETPDESPERGNNHRNVS